jgi:thiol-disulfide isomerase/thioredoxin
MGGTGHRRRRSTAPGPKSTTRTTAALAALLAWLPLACKTPVDAAPDPAPRAGATASAAPAPTRRMRTMNAPAEGDVDAIVRAAVATAITERRRVVVYVGATWCEPCQRFHHAVEQGELDATFPDVDLVTFDADRDSERLASAGYVSRLIPLLALPGPDGRASGKQVEGGIKGEGAVAYIAPRLEQMLAD